MLIPLSTVSASDINNTADNQVLSATPNVDTISANVNNGENNNDTLSVNDEKNILSAGLESGNNNLLGADEDIGSYSNLAKLIKLTKAGETLMLPHSYKYDSSIDSAYAKGITLDRTIIIDGNGKTIDANNQAAGFTISANNVVLKNFNLINCIGKNKVFASSIYWLGDNGTLDNVNISGASAPLNNTYAKSAGISWWGKNGIIKNIKLSDLKDNTGHTSRSGRGGVAISCAGINLKLYNITIENTGDNREYKSYHGWIAILGSSSNVYINNLTAVRGKSILLNLND